RAVYRLERQYGNRPKQEAEAVGVGFEPTIGQSPIPVFKTGAISRSATPPGVRKTCLRQRVIIPTLAVSVRPSCIFLYWRVRGRSSLGPISRATGSTLSTSRRASVLPLSLPLLRVMVSSL